MTPDQGRFVHVGDVLQINEHASDPCYVGCLLIVSEIKSWGVQGFIPVPSRTGVPAANVWLRPKWEALERIGAAVLTPAPSGEDGC